MNRISLLGAIASISLLFSSCGETEKEIEVSSIAIGQPSAEMEVGETLSLKVTVSPSNATYDGISWTSTKPKVATVSESGLVSALSEGNTIITAMAGGKTANCSITVVKKVVAVSSISLNKESINLVEGDSETLVATVLPDDAADKTVTWTSSKGEVATVNNGVVSAVSEGEATIMAKAGEKTATCKVVVAKRVIPVESIELDYEQLSLTEGESQTLTATVKPDNATDKTVSWESSDKTIAIVDKDGTITAIKVGNARIKASAGEKSATCEVEVLKGFVPVSSISLDQASISMFEGKTITLTATVLPEDATDKTVTWTSSDPSVVSVSENGDIQAFMPGAATITATAGSKQAHCLVNVLEKEPAIPFLDYRIKEKLVAKFDLDGDEEVSFREAASVTSGELLKEAFEGLTSFRSFDEFQYFTSVTTVPSHMFDSWINLDSVTLPENVKTIEDSAFGNCISLDSITIPESVTTIGNQAFSGCTGIKTLIIPERVNSIGTRAFSGCSELIDLYLLPATPPSAGTAILENADLCAITVPDASFNAYRSKPGWMEYANRIRKEHDITPPEGYTLVWNDEFDAPGLPSSFNWWYETGAGGWGNNELQTYVAGSYNGVEVASISDGTLKIKAQKIGSKVYSVRMNSQRSWTNGWFEARIKVTDVPGSLPMFWMMPKNFGSWPDDGEIDIMEYAVSTQGKDKVASTIHTQAYNYVIGTPKTHVQKVSNAAGEFHVYACEWTWDGIYFYIDGQLHLSFKNDHKNDYNTWPFDNPFYIKLNLAWGGSMGGATNDSNLPAVLEVDYVRVFQPEE